MCSVNKNDCRLYVKYLKGNNIKLLIDTYVNMSTSDTITFRYDKEGFRVNEVDDSANPTILIDNTTLVKNFAEYHLKNDKPYSFFIKTRHLQKILKNLRKKDMVTFFIPDSDRMNLCIVITPADTSEGRTEESTITANKCDPGNIVFVSSIGVDDDGNEYDNYYNPKKISSSDFQKTKKITTISSNHVIIEMYKSDFISFQSSDGGTCSTKSSFGSIPSPSSEDGGGKEEVSSESESENESESEDDSHTEDEDDNKEETSKEIEHYLAEFTPKIFTTLLKLPGIDSNMNFYAPRRSGVHLKIEMTNECIGTVTCFIKETEKK